MKIIIFKIYGKGFRQEILSFVKVIKCKCRKSIYLYIRDQ